MAQRLLEASGLSKSFGGIAALRDFAIHVDEGETLGVIGPNGAGKTTLFNLLSGAQGPDSGRILFRGRDISRLSPERRADLGMVRSFQAGRCFANLSVEENLLVGAQVVRIAARARLASGAVELAQAFFPFGPFRREEAGLRLRAATIASSFGERLSPRLADPAYSLSYANRRRLEIGRALASKPTLLLLDEPTAGMNPSETAEMLEYLEALKSKGLSMIVIEHKLPLVMRLSDRVVVMDDGEKIAEGDPLDVSRNARVIEAYLGSPREALRAASPVAPASPATPLEALSTPSPSEAPPLLKLESIDSFYGQAQVHHGLSLEVRQGEIVCLLGGNASGKSTAMKIILGLMKPGSGEVVWKGERITRLSTSERVELGIASVPEARRIFPEMSVEENILMGAYLRLGRRRIAARRAARRAVKADEERVLELFPRLKERLGQAGGTLSGGEQQMLAMARALMSSPKLICMDEPTMGLSPLFVERVLETVSALNKEGVSIFMVEQNAHQALSLAHRGYVLQNGRLVLQGTARELLDDSRIRDAYLGGETMSPA
jgi:branched-chain amino acid transport system ATP-binding protein